MIRLIHFVISMILSLLAYGASAQEFKLGKIGNNEFHKMATITDSSAGAIVLKNYRETHFDYDDAKGWIIVTKVQQRIKILKKEGISYATHKVKAYKKNKDKEFVTNVEGYTYTSENDVFSKEKLDKNAIFETENSEYWDSYSWTMPNVRIGSVLEWEYTLTSPFWKVDDLNIQQDLPIKEYEAVIRTPTSFKFNRLKKGYFEVEPVTAFKKRLEAVMMGQNTGYGGRSSINTRSATMALTEQIDTYHLENIPALQHEAFVDNIENYRYTIVYELNAVQYGDGHTKKYATSWGDVAKSIMDAEHFGKQLDKINFLYTDAGNIKKKGTGEELLIHNAFEFVRDNFSWNGKYGKYVEDDLNKVYKSRSGNDAEINLTLLALLKACGVSAHPVLISTKENGIPMFPTLEGFNYVIVGVRLKDELILLDATEKYSQPNVLPSRVYNWEGRMILPDGFSEIVNLYPKQPTQQNLIMNYSVGLDGIITGNVMKRYTALDALDFRRKNKGISIDKITSNLINELKIDQIENLEVKNIDVLDEPVVETYNFALENAYDQVGNSIYLSPMLFVRMGENPFKLKERQFPINFTHPFTLTRIINLKFPEEYQIESLPEPVNFALPEEMGSFVYKIAQNKNSLNLIIEFNINKPVIPVAYHSALQDLYNSRVVKENEKVVLTKIQ